MRVHAVKLTCFACISATVLFYVSGMFRLQSDRASKYTFGISDMANDISKSLELRRRKIELKSKLLQLFQRMNITGNNDIESKEISKSEVMGNDMLISEKKSNDFLNGYIENNDFELSDSKSKDIIKSDNSNDMYNSDTNINEIDNRDMQKNDIDMTDTKNNYIGNHDTRRNDNSDIQESDLVKHNSDNNNVINDIDVDVDNSVQKTYRFTSAVSPDEAREDIHDEKPLLYPFKNFLILPSTACPQDERMLYVIMVKSAISNLNRRRAIRDTYGQRNLFADVKYRVVFLVGTSADFLTSRDLRDEAAEFDDVIQGDFTDHYHNLTLKGVMGLRWFKEFCSNSSILINIDDDVFLNMFGLLNYVTPIFSGKTRLIGCSLRKANSSQISRSDGKWKVDEKYFPGLNHYPFTYCNGFFVVLSADAAIALYNAVKDTQVFWIDDVYLYGMLPQTAGDLNFVQMARYTTFRYNSGKECIEKMGVTCSYVAMTKFHDNFSIGHFYLVWAKYLARISQSVQQKFHMPKVEYLKKRLLENKDETISRYVRQGLKTLSSKYS